MATPKALKKNIERILRLQGYRVRKSGFSLADAERDTKRQAHYIAKAERMLDNESLVIDHTDMVKKFMVNGKDLDVSKIDPVLINVSSDNQWEILYRWWNLVWWSLPHERSYGRQMRFIVWDKYHKAPMGLIGLQSPILSWSVRDKYLGIDPKDRDFWVNQSLNAQRLGALPPYNSIYGGKLVASMMTTDYVRGKFKQKYSGIRTLMMDRKIPANLLFLTTTGAFGKSSVYSKLKVNGEEVSKFLGYTQGMGSFHIPNFLYMDLIKYLKKLKYDIGRGYGNGPSRKIRLIDQAMTRLGFKSGTTHSVKRSVYLFPMAKNISDVINKGAKPKWYKRSQKTVADFWKKQWAIPRSEKDKTYLEFSKDQFIENTIKEMEEYKKVYKKLKSI